MEQLIVARCNVNLQKKDGRTPLYLAARFVHASATKQLLQHGLTSTSKLLLAAHCNVDLLENCKLVHIIHQAGSFVQGRLESTGTTALQVAEMQGHAGIATLIRKRQARAHQRHRSKAELNGRTGTAVSFDDDKGRYSVELDETSSSFMIKSFNLPPSVKFGSM